VSIVDNLSLTATQKSDRLSLPSTIHGRPHQRIGRIPKVSTTRPAIRRIVWLSGGPQRAGQTCKFCTDQCTTKNIHDQIIEGLIDGDTVEDRPLLRKLDKTITMYRAQEAAKRQRAEMTQDTRVAPSIQTIRRIRPHQAPVCPGCGGGFHQGGRKQCPAYNLTCHTWISWTSSKGMQRMQGMETITPSTTTAIYYGSSNHTPPRSID
jgi:hypothetical protein